MLDRRGSFAVPPHAWPSGLVTHIERQPVDVDLALRQWQTYVAALETAGWETIQVPPMDDCPDGVFVEDTVVMYGDRAVITRPGADERKPETAAIADLLARARATTWSSIEAPGTLDGGDVLKHGGTVWVGIGGRTNQSGRRPADGVPRAVRRAGGRVPVSKVLHLKSAVTALPDGTVVGYQPLVDDPAGLAVVPRRARGARRRTSSCSATTVLMSTERAAEQAAASRSAASTWSRSTSREFEKLEGCVTCLSVRLRHTP